MARCGRNATPDAKWLEEQQPHLDGFKEGSTQSKTAVPNEAPLPRPVPGIIVNLSIVCRRTTIQAKVVTVKLLSSSILLPACHYLHPKSVVAFFNFHLGSRSD